jgi:hypothetical protein
MHGTVFATRFPAALAAPLLLSTPREAFATARALKKIPGSGPNGRLLARRRRVRRARIQLSKRLCTQNARFDRICMQAVEFVCRWRDGLLSGLRKTDLEQLTSSVVRCGQRARAPFPPRLAVPRCWDEPLRGRFHSQFASGPVTPAFGELIRLAWLCATERIFGDPLCRVGIWVRQSQSPCAAERQWLAR